MNQDINNLGTYANIAAVWAAYPEGGQEGDYLYIGSTKYRWNKYDQIWENASTVTEGTARKLTELFADVAVNNDLRVGGTLYYHRLKGYDLGLYSTLASLEAEHPSPEVGMWAFVVHPTISGKYQVYQCSTAGEWTLSVSETTLDILDFERYEEAIALMQEIANGRALTGYRAAQSVSDLPTEDVDPTLGWIVGNHLYIYVEEGGDTLGGLYQDCGQLRGEKGDKGDKGNDAVVLEGVSLADSMEAVEEAETPSETVPTANVVQAVRQEAADAEIAKWKQSVDSEVSTASVPGTLGAEYKTKIYIKADGTIDTAPSPQSYYYTYYATVMLPKGSVVHFHREATTSRRVRFSTMEVLPTAETVIVGLETDMLHDDSSLIHDYDMVMPYDGYLLWYWYNEGWESGTYRMEWWRGDRLIQLREDVDGLLTAPVCSSAGYPVSDLDIADESGNVIMRLSGGHVKTKNFDSSSLDSNFRPYQRLTRFTVRVDTGRPVDDTYSATGRGTEYMKTLSTDTDNAALYLPTTYDPSGKPTRLVMFGKQGGSFVTPTSDPIFGANYLNISPFLLSLGYALLIVDGTPDTWAASLITEGNDELDSHQNGNYVAVQSARRAYDYVIQNYNIDRSGVFGYGYSQGGWMIMNIAELSGIPFLAVVLKSPVLRLQGHWESGSEYKTADGQIVLNHHRYRYFMTKVWGIADACGVDDDEAVTDTWLESLDYDDWKWMWSGYDPYTRYATDEELSPNTVDIDDVTMRRTCRIPVKIWVAKDDSVVSSAIPAVFVKAIRNAGCRADIHVYNANGDHYMPPSIWSAVGTFEENGITRNVYPPTLEMAMWLYQFGGRPVNYNVDGEPVAPDSDDEDEDN